MTAPARRRLSPTPWASRCWPRSRPTRTSAANPPIYEIVGRPGGEWAPIFELLAEQVATAPPLRPTPLTQDGLLGLFKGEAVGRGYTLTPATEADMCADVRLVRPSLEVIYEGA